MMIKSISNDDNDEYARMLPQEREGFTINLNSSDGFAYLSLFLSQAAPAGHSGDHLDVTHSDTRVEHLRGAEPFLVKSALMSHPAGYSLTPLSCASGTQPIAGVLRECARRRTRLPTPAPLPPRTGEGGMPGLAEATRPCLPLLNFNHTSKDRRPLPTCLPAL